LNSDYGNRPLLLHNIATRDSTLPKVLPDGHSSVGRLYLQLNILCYIISSIFFTAAASWHYHQGQHIVPRLLNLKAPNTALLGNYATSTNAVEMFIGEWCRLRVLGK
jgi:hypothetical protein